MASAIWLGDLVVALATVGASDDESLRIARMLGLGPTSSLPPEPPPLQEPPTTTAKGRAPTADKPVRDQDHRIRQGEMARPSSTRDEVETGSAEHSLATELPILTPVAQQPVARTGWGVSSSLQRVSDEHLHGVVDHEPLFAPRSASAALTAAVATESLDGPLDVDALVAVLARRQPHRRLPRKRRRSLRFGVQLLIDIGEAMQPFARDQQVLVSQVRRVVGTDRTSMLYFADCPGRGAGPGPRRTWRTYRPPESGTRVLVVSDFGIGGPALSTERSHEHEWRSFVMAVRRAASTVIGLVPYPPWRWPQTLTSLMPLVTWDRSTTVARVFTARAGR
jgi:hypothetical protein